VRNYFRLSALVDAGQGPHLHEIERKSGLNDMFASIWAFLFDTHGLATPRHHASLVTSVLFSGFAPARSEPIGGGKSGIFCVAYKQITFGAFAVSGVSGAG
jgi:hypothetical protein